MHGVMVYRQERCLWIDGGINGNGMEVQLALALARGNPGRRSVVRRLDAGPSPGRIRAESGAQAASCRVTTMFWGSIVLTITTFIALQACHLSVARRSFSPLLIKSALSARVDSLVSGAS